MDMNIPGDVSSGSQQPVRRSNKFRGAAETELVDIGNERHGSGFFSVPFKINISVDRAKRQLARHGLAADNVRQCDELAQQPQAVFLFPKLRDVRTMLRNQQVFLKRWNRLVIGELVAPIESFRRT